MIPTGHDWAADGDTVRCVLCGATLGTREGDFACMASAAEPDSLPQPGDDAYDRDLQDAFEEPHE